MARPRSLLRLAPLLIGTIGCAIPSRPAVSRDGRASVDSVAAASDRIGADSRGDSTLSRKPDAEADLENEHRAKVQLTASEEIASESGTAVASAESTVEEKVAGPVTESPVYTLTLFGVIGLADSRNPNVILARERINEAYARVDRAEALWLPSLRAGLNYNHHEGAIQDVAGNVFNTTRSSFYGGFGANAVGAGSPAVPGLSAQFHLSDAIFQPRSAAHQAASRQYGAAAVRNDTLRDTAVAYLELVRSEHALAIAEEALANTRQLAELTREYADAGEGLQSDHQRMEAELALRQDRLVSAQEDQLVASARLAQLLHSNPGCQIVTGEPAVVPLSLITLDKPAAEFVSMGLTRRPELAEHQHLVCEAVERLNREKYAPLIPSVLLGVSYGGLGGSIGSSIRNTDDRVDADAVAFWEIRNLGAGERAARDEAGSVIRQAQWRQVALLDRVAREVAEAHSQVAQRERRIESTRIAIQSAERSYALNRQRIENKQGLPIEVLQSIQALATARQAYLNSVVDYNIAQFQLCRAVGWFEHATP